jgi:hypothetical protein
MRVRRLENAVSLQCGVRNLERRARLGRLSFTSFFLSLSPHLTNDVLVEDADDQAVLRGVVLVLVLVRQALAGIVVRHTLAPTAELDLVPLEVRLVLHDLDETLRQKEKKKEEKRKSK